MQTTRLISHSELSMAMTCQARWSFAYGGQLTGGTTLKRRQLAPILSDGRAWGAGVAAWYAHKASDTLLGAYDDVLARIGAHAALRNSYARDVASQRASGFPVLTETAFDTETWLMSVLDHHMSIAPKLENLTMLEGEITVPIPSRKGVRASTRYRYNGYVDGFTVDDTGARVFEAKLRTGLTPFEILQIQRQPRYYVWGLQQKQLRGELDLDELVTGVMVEERLAEAPKPPKIVKAKRKRDGIDGRTVSHDKQQLCTAEDYIAVCAEFGVEYHDDVVDYLQQRRWYQRWPIDYTPAEIKEAGEELVSAAKLIRDLDSGEKWPVRNSQPQLCKACRFLPACANPHDDHFLDTIYERGEPKRLREPLITRALKDA